MLSALDNKSAEKTRLGSVKCKSPDVLQHDVLTGRHLVPRKQRKTRRLGPSRTTEAYWTTECSNFERRTSEARRLQ